MHDTAVANDDGYAELIDVFTDFRAIVPPEVVDGVPDYSNAAMAARYRKLEAVRQRLDAIDDSDCPVSRRVDYTLVLGEMRGLEFQQQSHAPVGSARPGVLQHDEPGLRAKDARSRWQSRTCRSPMTTPPNSNRKLAAVPAILSQARRNLTDARGDLARLGITQKRIELNVYTRLADDVVDTNPALARRAAEAADATLGFIEWLEEIEGELPAHGGVGLDNYNWLLRHVLLFPYSWEDMEVIGQREYERSMVFLKLEEHRHADIPMIEPATSMDEFERRRADADRDLLEFLERKNIMTGARMAGCRREPEGPYILPAEIATR